MTPAGHIVSVEGSLVRAELDAPVALGETVHIAEERLFAEIIALKGHGATAQVYEDTVGLKTGAPLWGTGEPLSVELGPGLLGAVFDGIQRPLAALARTDGDFLGRGRQAPALDRDRLWPWSPKVAPGEVVDEGAILGAFPETPALEHRILAPRRGTVTEVAAAGPLRVADVVARIDGLAVTMVQRAPVRVARRFRARLQPSVPMITGQRVLDTFFPLARGSTAGLPGSFGTGKTVLQHQIVKWAEADVIVFVGCGERGNEMTRMLRELPELVDPRTGRPLADRTILVANTSNMPVSAREASLYTGVTMAEYWRDMGYHVALLADSTSRWAEALREISGRLGEMPAEEGYPPNLSSRLAAYYERAGRVTTVNGAEGSVTLISAISPPGGDPTEPVTRHTQSFTRVFWTLDRDLASARVFPAVSLRDSYSEAVVDEWWGPEWARLRRDALALLEEAGRLEMTARLIGADSLPDRQRFLLSMAQLLREGFLIQNASDPADACCAPGRQIELLSLLMKFAARGLDVVGRGTPPERIFAQPIAATLARARVTPSLDGIGAEIERALP